MCSVLWENSAALCIISWGEWCCCAVKAKTWWSCVDCLQRSLMLHILIHKIRRYWLRIWYCRSDLPLAPRLHFFGTAKTFLARSYEYTLDVGVTLLSLTSLVEESNSDLLEDLRFINEIQLPSYWRFEKRLECQNEIDLPRFCARIIPRGLLHRPTIIALHSYIATGTSKAINRAFNKI